MKKVVGLILVLMMIFAVITTSLADNSTWRIQYAVDEFGDPTEDCYIIGGPFKGTFNNSATTNSDLSVYVFCVEDSILLRLFEYGDNVVNNPYSKISGYKMAVKASLDHCNTPQKFYYWGGIMSGKTDLEISNVTYNDNFIQYRGPAKVEGVEYYTLFDVFERSSEVKFSITSNKNPMDKYIFTIQNPAEMCSLYRTIYPKEFASYLRKNDTAKPVSQSAIREATGKGEGFFGEIKVKVVKNGDTITSIEVLSHSDTPGICENAIDKIPSAIISANSVAVDCVSGATLTSKGIIDAVADALKQLEN